MNQEKSQVKEVYGENHLNDEPRYKDIEQQALSFEKIIDHLGLKLKKEKIIQTILYCEGGVKSPFPIMGCNQAEKFQGILYPEKIGDYVIVPSPISPNSVRIIRTQDIENILLESNNRISIILKNGSILYGGTNNKNEVYFLKETLSEKFTKWLLKMPIPPKFIKKIFPNMPNF